MAFVDGQKYTGKNGKEGIWNAQTGTFHVVDGEINTKYTAAEFLEQPETVQVSVPISEE